jgi:hypothetical protein
VDEVEGVGKGVEKEYVERGYKEEVWGMRGMRVWGMRGEGMGVWVWDAPVGNRKTRTRVRATSVFPLQ